MDKRQPKGRDWYRQELRQAYKALEQSAHCTHYFVTDAHKSEAELKKHAKAVEIAIAKLSRIQMGCSDPEFQAGVALDAIQEVLN